MLGAIIANNRAFDQVAEFLEERHFADPIHGMIYRRICERLLDGRDVSAPLLKSDFEQTGLLDAAGGTAYLAQLVAAMITPRYVTEYARNIVDNWMRRQLIEIGLEVVNQAFGSDPSIDATKQVGQAERMLVELGSMGRATYKLTHAGDAIAKAIAKADDTSRSGIAPGLISGLATIDKGLCALLEPETLTLLGGLPGSGKTALVGQMSKAIAQRVYDQAIGRGLSPERARSQPGVLLISLEMTAEQIGHRLAAEEAGINSWDLREGKIDVIAASNLVTGQLRTRNIPFRIHDMIGLNVRLLPQKIMMHIQRQPELLVVVDNLLTRGSDDDDKRRASLDASTVSWLTGQLKTLSTRLSLPILALTHIGRPAPGVVRRPSQEAVKWAGEGDADNVAFVHRPLMLMESTAPTARPGESEERFLKRKSAWRDERDMAKDLAELVIAKARQGKTGVHRLRWHGATTSFREWDTETSDDGGFE